MKNEIKKFDEINELAYYIYLKIKENKLKSIGLIGDLGTGKTHFVKKICEFLKINEVVKSPTFNYVNVYFKDDLKISHFDVYRLESEDEIYEIGYDDYLDGIILVEWADKIYNILPEDTLFIEFDYFDIDKRKISIFTKFKGEKKYVDIFNF